jgi:dTDP-4-amino-4,6-dideoxygalactose transaminase
VQAAYLWGQLEDAEKIAGSRMRCWQRYERQLGVLEQEGHADLPKFTSDSNHNAHCFYIKLRDPESRADLIAYLKNAGVLSVFHYVPLHSSEAGKKFGRFHGEDRYTSRESERLLRLPLFYSLTDEQIDYISGKVRDFFSSANKKNQ